jgi:hypothetical protein
LSGVHSIGRAGASIGELIVGAGRAERRVLEVVRSAKGHLMADVMTWKGEPATEALRTSLERGSRIDLLASPMHDPADFARALDVTRSAARRLRIHPYDRTLGRDGPELWQHSKLLVVRDSPNAAPSSWFTNVSPHFDSPRIVDVTAQLTGASADAAATVASAWARGASTSVMRRQVDAAARAGLLLNEPAAGRLYVSSAFEDLVRGAQHRLILITKGLDDVQLAQQLATARRRGANVAVVSHHLGADSAAVLARSGVPVALPSTPDPRRVNMLVADHTGLLTTAYPIREVLRRGPAGVTAGRESALLLRGSALARAEAAVRDTDVGRAAYQLTGTRAPQLQPSLGAVAPPSGQQDALTGFRMLEPQSTLPNIVDVVG